MSRRSAAEPPSRIHHPVDRRGFLATSAALAAGTLLRTPERGWSAPANPCLQTGRIDAFIREKIERDHIPGIAAAILDRNGIVWESGYGWADLERRVPMTTDTLQNVASISKTFAATSILQLREQGMLQLDDNIETHLGFAVRNPNHPDQPISIGQLLTHTSSLRDGAAYSRAYQCGDPSLGLGEWLERYYTPGDAFYSREENFWPWAPGERWDYANLPFGLLARIVERVSGLSYPEYTRRRIFARVGMHNSGWLLTDVDASNHAVPYTLFENGNARGPTWGGLPQGVIQDTGAASEALLPGDFRANCRYNHPNFPDGFLRTSVRQLAGYARAYLNGGLVDGNRILAAATVAEMFRPQLVLREGAYSQGLTWAAHLVAGEPAWGHTGGDPGVNTDLRMMPGKGVAAIAFTNTHGIAPASITGMLLQEAQCL